MNIKGKIKFIGQTTDVSNTFQARDLVVTTEEQYPQHILIQFVQDKCNLLNQSRVGQVVTVDINLRGREWVNPQGETRYFNSIQGWRISLDPNDPANQSPQTSPLSGTPNPNNEAAKNFQAQANFEEEEHDDLPF